jgi:hypothetical protein
MVDAAISRWARRAQTGRLTWTAAGALDPGQGMTRNFNVHHTPGDTLDMIGRAQLDQNVTAWSAAIWLAATGDRPLRTL